MTRQTLQTLTFLTLVACNNVTQKADNIAKKDSIILKKNQKLDITKKPELAENETIINRDSSLIGEFKTFRIYQLADTINSDLNGDNILDLAFFSNQKIYIIDGQTKKRLQVGLDKSFGDMRNDFSWVDFWGTTEDRETYEIVIKDSEIIGDKTTKLDNNSIFVRKDEVGGGVITYKDGKFIWVHQSD
jgi:hypothetical protein